MPRTKFQTIIFTLLMSLVMVYGMICYNVALSTGAMTNKVFLISLHELIIMWPIAFILEFFIVDKLAHMLAFRIVTPKDKPIFIILAISTMIVCIMCPIMSLIATILFKGFSAQIIAVWLKTVVFNFPMAFFFQICYCGPFVRWIFKLFFPNKQVNA